MSTFTVERRAANQVPPDPTPGDAFGLRSAIDSVLQHGRLAGSVFAAVMLFFFAYATVSTPVYHADTLVRVESRHKDSLLPSMAANEKPVAETDRANLPAEMGVLVSREMLLPVIAAVGADVDIDRARRYGLPVAGRHGVEVAAFRVPAAHQGKAFVLTVSKGHFELTDKDKTPLAKGPVGTATAFALDGVQGVIEVRAAADLPTTEVHIRQLLPVKAFQDVTKRLRTVELARDSGVMRVSFEDDDPERAAALLNGLVQRYLDSTVQRKGEDAARALNYVEAQLPALKARVDAAEAALSRYQLSSRAAPGNTEADSLLRQRNEMEKQLVDLQLRRDQLSQSVTAAHPELAAVLRQMGTVKSALERLAAGADRLPDQQRDLVRLQRDLASETQIYTTLLNQAQQMRVAGGSWLATARQVDRAVAPLDPVRPKLAAVMSIGTAAALLLALSAALLAHALQPTVTNARELLARSVPPTLAVIPESPAQKRLMAGRVAEESLDEMGTHLLLARAAPDDAAVESLRSVHMSLMLRESTLATKVILVTSPRDGVGKSFIAANLAAVMAETGRRVLLIEADLRNPGLHKYVGIDEAAAGVSDLLSRTRSLDRVIHAHPSAGFDVILQGSRTKKKGSLLLSADLATALTELRTRYDHVVINGAPAMPTRDALVVGRLADIALMVVRAEHSLLHETRTAVRRLEQSGIKMEGLLFNGAKRNRLNPQMLT